MRVAIPVTPRCGLRIVLALLLFGALAGATAPAAQRNQKNQPPRSQPRRATLQPKLEPGDVVRYQIEFRTTSDTKSGGSVADPEGPSQVVITWDAKIRLDVLAAPDSAGTGAKLLRTTYEQSTATVQSDTPDPETSAIVKQYQQLEGRALEFTLAADGQVTAARGLEGFLPDQNTVNAAQQWVSQLSGGGGAPPTSISPGMTWSSEQAADKLPLAGLSWRTDSTYLRDESCRPALASGGAPSQPDDMCAVILTSLTLSPSRPKADGTPEEFRRNGLQSSGSWTGSGDSLSYVSLRTGWVVSASQSSEQKMDVNITSALGSTVHYGGTVATHSQISLLLPDSSAPPTSPSTPNESSSHTAIPR
jgi:hypothetical protein